MELEQLEGLSLTEDRKKAVDQLIPGTEDHYFYLCLLQQHQGKLAEAESTLNALVNRYSWTTRARELRARQALLGYDKEPQKTLTFLREELSLSFDHQREATQEELHYPSKLDPKLIERKALIQQAFGQYNLGGFTDRALRWLPHHLTNIDQKREFLRRATLPDLPDLLSLIVEELDTTHSGGFGALSIHYALSLSQLDELLRIRPSLQENPNFIKSCIRKLAPQAGVNLDTDDEERDAYLNRLWGLAGSLLPAFNSLKAHLLYHMLALNMRRNQYNRERFETYLTLPRQASYMKHEFLARQSSLVRLGQDDWGTGLARVYDDEAVVRAHLSHFFEGANQFDEWKPYLREDYLQELFATTKITTTAQPSTTDGERWYSLLNNPSKYQALKERVDLELAPQNKMTFAESDPIVIEVYTKNVPSLLVKVFEINARNYYLSQKKEIDTAIDLDGLVATQEKTYQYDTPALQRVLRTFRFDDLTGPGVYVIEFIGNGRSSRALIFKGSLRFIERQSAAGHAFTILNEAGEHVKEATLWLSGREYRPNEHGEVIVPYSTNPGRVQLLLCHKEVFSLVHFDHAAERYQFTGGLFLDREQLLARKTARVMFRPCLTLNNTPVSLSLIERPTLIIETIDRHGTNARLESPVTLSASEEGVHSFQVPEDLLHIVCTLRGSVRSITEQHEINLEDQTEQALNEIESTSQIEDLHLSLSLSGYVVSLLGKTGEPKPKIALQVTLQHQEFTQPTYATLQTDTEGRVVLGELTNVETLTVQTPSGVQRSWRLFTARCAYPQTLHTASYDDVKIPYAGRHQTVTPESFSLFERRGDTIVKDCFSSLQLTPGKLLLTGLRPGDYELWLHEYSHKISLTVVAGEWCNGWVIGSRRAVEVQNPPSLFVSSAEVTNDELVIQLDGELEGARVHVIANRLHPKQSLRDTLGLSRWLEGRQSFHSPRRSFYLSGREIGNEYRYVLERKLAKKFPGNTLERPGLLLNPWDIRTTTTNTETLKEGESYRKDLPEIPLPMGAAAMAYGGRAGGGGGARIGSSCIDFVPETSVIVSNATPDGLGVVRIKRSQLGEHTSIVRVIALSESNSVERWVTLPESRTPHRDLRLREGLAPEKHFGEQAQGVSLKPNETLTLQDISTSSVERYETLASAYRLLLSLSGNATLPEFSFILEWPRLDIEKKRAHYSDKSCHELNLFLYFKDREFFTKVVAPYLKNKKHKTFLDKFFLDEDLREYTRPVAFHRLNIVEKILLSRRVASEKADIERTIKDHFDAVPIDPVREEQLLRAALKSGALEADGDMPSPEEPMMEQMEPAPEMLDDEPTGVNMFGADGIAPGMPAMAQMEPPKPSAPPAARRMAAKRDEIDLKSRAQIRALYRAADKTKERAENNYYKLRPSEQGPELVQLNAFWSDFAAHDLKGPFLSSNFVYATSNFTELMCTLAVLDLPFEAPKSALVFEGRKLTIKAKSDAIVFYREISEAKSTKRSSLLLSQEYFRADDRYTYEKNEHIEKPVKEFLAHVVYVCQVVLTNPSSSRQKLSVLLQIPQGAMPVADGFVTRSQQMRVEAYSTQTIEYSFYFPKPGECKHFPVNASRYEECIAFAQPRTLKVLQRPEHVDTTSWSYLSQHGEPKAVLAALESENLHRIDLGKIAWRMQEKKFFHDALTRLTRRRAFHRTLWSYGVLHNDAVTIRELLQQEGLARSCGKVLHSSLLEVDPVQGGVYEHLEYSPLINARAHKLSAKAKILNEALAAQYESFLHVLSYQPTPTSEQLLSAVYYCLLQDRVDDAQTLFSRVKPAALAEQMQYDYVALYLAIYREEYDEAKKLAEQYKDYPVDKWRRLFEAALVFFEEASGAEGRVVSKDDRVQAQNSLAAKEPSLDFTVTGEELTIRYQNVASCRLNYYLMDIELLFSRQPFVQQASARFSMLKPNSAQEITLEAEKSELRVEMPAPLRGKNVVIEVTAAGAQKAQVRYAHQLAVQVIEPYGQLRARHAESKKPVSKCYVKVYAKKQDGSVVFYKDGYTDLRGLFDYASLSTDELDSVQRFSLLLLSDEHGAMITEANPPAR